MTRTNAIVYVDKGKATIQDVPKPKLRDEYVLVKVHALGLNPTDWKHIDFGVTESGSRIGCDYAGVVEAVGSKVQKHFTKGDRICGVVHGGLVLGPCPGYAHTDMTVATGLSMRTGHSQTTLLPKEIFKYQFQTTSVTKTLPPLVSP